MDKNGDSDKESITVRLSKRVLEQARMLAARRSMSVTSLLASELERLVAAEDGCQPKKG
jgi:predicted HicB family RNase H-like nuclease